MGEARKSPDVPLDTLTRQRALLDGLFARVPEAIVLLDSDERILQVNPEFTRVFGYSQEEACGRLINDLVVPEELFGEAGELSVVDLSDPAAVPPEIYDKVIAEGLKSACLIPLVNRGRVCPLREARSPST